MESFKNVHITYVVTLFLALLLSCWRCSYYFFSHCCDPP